METNVDHAEFLLAEVNLALVIDMNYWLSRDQIACNGHFWLILHVFL
jgi:hypothetical protein